MIASHTEASTRSESTSMSALRPVLPSGAVARNSSGTPSSRATRAHDAPLTAWARTFVSRPAPWRSKRGYRWSETARLRTTSPRKASRSYASARCSTHEACVKACRRRSSGSSASTSSSDSGLDPACMGGDEVCGLADREDLGRLLVRDADPVAVLELDHELHQVERVRLEVLLEAGGAVDALGVDLQFGGQVLPDAVENLFAGHRGATLAALADRNAPAPSRAAVVRPTMSSSTARAASFTACSIPVGPKLPCATTTGFRSPSRIAPPTFSGSRSSRSFPSLPRTSRPPRVETAPERTRERISPKATLRVPSSTFSATLPVNPSATSTSGVPLPDSSPTDKRPTDGRSIPTTASMKPAPM